MSFAFNKVIAFSLFCACDLSDSEAAAKFVGTCTTRTAVSTLFTFCPPGPLERENSNLTSLSGILKFSASIRGKSGRTSTRAKEVCLKPFESYGEIRTNLCTPASFFKNPYTYSPLISIVSGDKSRTCHPLPSAYLRYIDSNIDVSQI